MRTRLFAVISVCSPVSGPPLPPKRSTARARFRPRDRRDLPRRDRRSVLEPDARIIIASEGLGQIGDNVDFVNTLGIEQKTFRQFKVVLRPGTKHKFRFEYTPINYTAENTVPASFVFNGQRFNIGIPVATEMKWNAYRFGYEWDFLYRDRGFAGVVLEVKYTDVSATLTAARWAPTAVHRARAPIPAIGFIGRGYVIPNISITGEFTFFKLPERRRQQDYSARYYDFDIYGTVNFNDHIGAQVGYRSFDVFYKVKRDTARSSSMGCTSAGSDRF